MSLADFAGPERLHIAAYGALIADALQSRGLSAMRLIFGAGLGQSPELGDGLRPVVLVSAEDADHEAGLFRLTEVKSAWNTLSGALQSEPEWLNEVGAFIAPFPEVHGTPGDNISIPAVGRMGCGVSWNGGNGFVTAGHIALARGRDVYSGGTKVGTVKFVRNPATSGAAPEADVGIVESSAGTVFSSRLAGTSLCRPNDPVIIHKSRQTTASIMGLCSYLYISKINGTYGDTYFTRQCATVPGDSGSAVAIGTEVVGIVVAGTPQYTTYIQDIRYVLSRCSQPHGGLSGVSV